ncbi:MAG: ABC transporter substrate-binding protein [Deltaproteobacteria bacterium]|jgi:putative ABC transport system substrate-binding protein|nr:ABC transporter substrate-binding protein [Deltaproteobacteria bacterium]
MKKLLLGLLCAAMAFLAIPALAYDVSILQHALHPSLDAAAKGFQDVLTESGLDVKINPIRYSQGNPTTSQQNVNDIIDENPALILAVSTPSAMHLVAKIKEIPILFTAVTDPVAAELVASLDKPGGNVTGTSDMSPLADLVGIIREIHPGAKTIGTIYNTGEVNSVVQIEIVKKAAADKGFTLVEAPTADSAGVTQAAQNLVGNADVILIVTDNTAIASYEAILKVALDHKIPLYPAEADSLAKGGTLTLSLDYYELGRQTGQMGVKILKDGVKPADLPVEFQKNFKLVYNSKYLEQIGQTLPKSVLDRATEVSQ